jgi:hypothetical protein
MEGLSIATFPVEQAAISGESLPFRTTLENQGKTPLQYPSENSPSQFSYELRPRRQGGRTYILSAAGRNQRRSTNLPPRVPVQYNTLAPGETVERIEDLADFLNEGIEPGDYFATVQYPAASLASARCLMTIRPANVESWSSAVSGNSLTSVLAHREEDGGMLLLQRESLRDPSENVFYRRQALSAGSRVAVATAIDVVPAGAGRWFAWLRDRTLTASNGTGNRTVTTSQAVGVDAPEPQLLSPGFQVALGTAVFGIVDRRGNAVLLITYLADRTGLKYHWTASLTSTGAGRAQWNCQPDGSVTVVWQEPSSGRLLSREFQADGRAKEAAPRVRTSSRPAAWSVAPTGPLAISVLGVFEGSYRYARLGAEAMADPKPIAELPGVTSWDFTPAENRVTIFAATPAGISQIRPGGAWLTVVKTDNPQRLHVFIAPDGSPWAEWVSPGYGIRRAKLP